MCFSFIITSSVYEIFFVNITTENAHTCMFVTLTAFVSVVGKPHSVVHLWYIVPHPIEERSNVLLCNPKILLMFENNLKWR